MPFKLTAAICPMRSGLTPSVRRNSFFSGRRASSASITPKLRHTLSAARQEACAPPITGMRNASRQASITGSLKQYKTTASKPAFCPSAASCTISGAASTTSRAELSSTPEFCGHTMASCVSGAVYSSRMRQRKAISSCVMP